MRAARATALFFVVLSLPLSALSDATLREPIAQWSHGEPAIAGVVVASGSMLASLYEQRDYRLLWDQRRAEGLHRLLVATRRDGFYRGDFHYAEIDGALARGGLSDLPADERAALDVLLSDSLLRYLHHHRYGKVDATRIDPSWGQSSPPAFESLAQDLRDAIEASDLESQIAAVIRWPGFYRELRDGLERYRRLAEMGPWPTVPDGSTIKAGMRDEQVPRIRARLTVTGDYPDPGVAADPLLYDAPTQAAVERFQERHGLAKDGVVGPETRAAMNVSVAQRIDQIRVNLERMRWVADRLPEDFVLVDIPGYRVQLFRRGQPIFSSRAIVGRPERSTPVFRDELAYLELNPTWTVPPTILAEDILPKMQIDPNYIYDRGLRVIDREGRSIAPESVNWYLPARAFPYMLRQGPGEENALGRVKFMFPNRFSVYLHDTPERDLFNRTVRALSSGCVRVEEPLRLAELVLDDPHRWNAARFEDLLDEGKTRVVRLERPIPVLLTYWTAVAEEAGRVHFRPDIYARDEAVLRVLDGGAIQPHVAPPVSPQAQIVGNNGRRAGAASDDSAG